MPAAPVQKMGLWAWPLLGALLSALGYWIYRQPNVIFIVGALVVIVWVGMMCDTRHRRGLVASRQDERICDFARCFDRRKTDTWIVRAVYEELSRYLSVDGRPVPVRPADNCGKDLKIDPDDLEDLAGDIAFRAQRSLQGAERNPLYCKVQTVADLVTFLENQPRVSRERLA
jgi:hypothetical protein